MITFIDEKAISSTHQVYIFLISNVHISKAQRDAILVHGKYTREHLKKEETRKRREVDKTIRKTKERKKALPPKTQQRKKA
jgi:hypothetical protein